MIKLVSLSFAYASRHVSDVGIGFVTIHLVIDSDFDRNPEPTSTTVVEMEKSTIALAVCQGHTFRPKMLINSSGIRFDVNGCNAISQPCKYSSKTSRGRIAREW